MTYTKLVKEDYKNFIDNDPFTHHSKDAQYLYGEGFSDGFFQAFVALKKSGLVTHKELLKVIRSVDTKKESLTYDVLEEDYVAQ
jgi:hypothetical protein